MDLCIRYITVGSWNENAYIIEYKGNSILIDPGDDFQKLENFFLQNKTKHIAILNTHGHFDHIGAVQDFKDKYEIPFYIHSKDKRVVHQANLLRKFAGVKQVLQTPKIDFHLDEITSFYLLDKEIKVHYTPGHSAGSVCFEIDKMLISGDTLFKDSLGRIDLPGGNKMLLNQSVKFILDNFMNYQVYPGHGSPFILDEDAIKRIEKLL
jgi:glyoxylase-like metal-dependent hydrolase (beta-lactamase superfamily II)